MRRRAPHAPRRPGLCVRQRIWPRIALGAALLLSLAAARAQDTPAPAGVTVVNGCALWPYAQCPGADLRHARLAGLDLHGANLRGAHLARADLRQTNLAGAVLDEADLSAVQAYALNAPGASFRGARLVGAQLEMARLMRADFSGADLRAANLEAGRLNFAWMIGTDLRDADLQETKFVATNLKNARLEGSLLRFTIFPDAFIEGCSACPPPVHEENLP